MPGTPKCIKCGKDIEADTDYTTADHGDVFHDACFTCTLCDKVIEQAFVCKTEDGADRKFGHQKPFYYHPDCAKTAHQKPSAGASTGTNCCVCALPLTAESGGIQMIDGRNLHHSCFKCNTCGNVEDSSSQVAMRLLRTKIGLLIQGKYECDVCKPPPDPSGAGKSDEFVANLEVAKAQAEAERLRIEAETTARQQREAAKIAAADAKKQAELDAAEAAEKAKADALQAQQDALHAMGSWSLEDLKDKAKCTAAGMSMNERESYLPDEVFEELFKCTKAEFVERPKWKKDGDKKKLGLY